MLHRINQSLERSDVPATLTQCLCLLSQQITQLLLEVVGEPDGRVLLEEVVQEPLLGPAQVGGLLS